MGARRLASKKTKSASQLLPRWQRPEWLTKRLLGAAILFSIFGGVFGSTTWYLLQPATLPIDQVQVKGVIRYLDKQALYDAVGELASTGFFSVDVHAVKQAAETLPWVDRVSVRRVWPNVLQVDVVEHVPLARWSDGRVVNRRGELIDTHDAAQLSAYPEFSGPEGSSETVAKRFHAMSVQLSELGLGISKLSINPRRAWQVSLSNGLKLLLGRATNEQQIARFTDAYKEVLASRVEQIQSIDLRYTNGFSVRWKTAAS